MKIVLFVLYSVGVIYFFTQMKEDEEGKGFGFAVGNMLACMLWPFAFFWMFLDKLFKKKEDY